mgnify:CR=1 FL=1
MNSPKIPVKSVHPAGGQSRPPLQRVRRVVVGADDSVGPLRSYKFAVDSRKNGAFCRADVGIGPYKRVGKRIRIRLGFPEKATASSEPTESSAPTDAVYLLRFMKIGF